MNQKTQNYSNFVYAIIIGLPVFIGGGFVILNAVFGTDSETNTNESEIQVTENNNLDQFTVNATQFKSQIDETDNPKIIDVRTLEEFNAERIQGSKNFDISLGDESFVNSFDILNLDKEDKLFIYCQSGNRSRRAVELLSQNGFTNLVELGGGIVDWKLSGFKTITN